MNRCSQSYYDENAKKRRGQTSIPRAPWPMRCQSGPRRLQAGLDPNEQTEDKTNDIQRTGVAVPGYTQLPLRPRSFSQNWVPTGRAGGKADRTPRIAGFSKESTFGPGFCRILMGEALKSALRPAIGRPEAVFGASPLDFGQNSAQKCPPY